MTSTACGPPEPESERIGWTQPAIAARSRPGPPSDGFLRLPGERAEPCTRRRRSPSRPPEGQQGRDEASEGERATGPLLPRSLSHPRTRPALLLQAVRPRRDGRKVYEPPRRLQRPHK